MVFWIVCALLTTLGIAFVVRPLLRNAGPQSDRSETEIAIYRDQLQEIGRDLERNLIDTEEAQAAKLEVSRRLLAADAASRRQCDRAVAPPSPPAKYERLAIVLAGVIIVFTMGGYLAVGSPGLPSLPHAERAATDPVDLPIGELIARVEARLAENPDDARGWDVIAPVYLRLERYAEAVQAFQRAIQQNGENERRLAQYAEAILRAGNGDVSDAVVAVYRRLLTLRPDDPVAHFWLAVRHEQQNRPELAIDGYRKLLARQDLPPAMRQSIADRIAALGGQAPARQPPPLADDVGPGDAGKGLTPSQEAIEEMARLSPEERQERIRAMADNFATRLRQDGGDLSEWQRLMRVFSVLGETKKAEHAYRDALAAFQDKPQESKALKALAAQLGITVQAGKN